MRISDWSSDVCSSDLGAPTLQLTENPDILTMLATSPHRPRLLIGFAAETDHVIDHATAKRAKKDADWIVANDVSGDVMGGAANTVHIIRPQGDRKSTRLNSSH